MLRIRWSIVLLLVFLPLIATPTYGQAQNLTDSEGCCGPDDYAADPHFDPLQPVSWTPEIPGTAQTGSLLIATDIPEVDQLVAECLSAAEIPAERRAQLIAKALASARQETTRMQVRDAAFALDLQTRMSGQPEQAPLAPKSIDAYFQSPADDELGQMRNDLQRLALQQQRMQTQLYQINQAYASIWQSVRTLSTQVAQANTLEMMRASNAYRLPSYEYELPESLHRNRMLATSGHITPSYEYELAESPRPLEPIQHSYTVSDSKAPPQYQNVNDEYAQLTRALAQIQQRLDVLQLQNEYHAPQVSANPLDPQLPPTSKPRPLLPR